MAVGSKIGAPMASSGLITDIDTVQRNPLGFRVSDDQGNQYSYQQGVASLAAGDWVVIGGNGVVARAVSTPLTGPAAVAIAAVLAGQFGWFQVRGVTPAATAIATDSGGASKPLFLSATAGRATTTLAAGNAILGAWAYGNPASNVGPALISDPFCPGFTLASA